MKPVLPIICTRYEVRNPICHLPDIRHSFGEQSIGYCLIKQLNAEDGSLATDVVLTESFLIYKIHIKRAVIDGYIAIIVKLIIVMYVTDKTTLLCNYS